jgi:hypothetical protein
MRTTNYTISKDLYLVQQKLNPGHAAKEVKVDTSFILVLDCSGSMSWDLPLIRDQLKKRLPKLLKEKDLLSIIWFSGKNEFGTLLSAEPVVTLKDLADVNAAIDRWLKPVCLTGFLQPIQEVSTLMDSINKKHPGYVHALLFLSDGCDNQWNRADILKATEKASGGLASATFVEYGYYADRPLLTAMAEKSGGTLIFSEDFDRYAPLFEASLSKKLSGAPRVEVDIKGDPIGGFAFAMVDGDLLSFDAADGTVTVPEDLTEVWYLSPTPIGEKGEPISGEDGKHPALGGAYAAISQFSLRMKPNVVFPLLKAIGDVTFIEKFSGCFGKQKYTTFMDAAREAAFNTKQRFTNGWDPNKVPKDDAFTVLDLLNTLADDDGNRLLLDKDDFEYKRISQAREDASDKLTDKEAKEVKALTDQITKEKDLAKLKTLQDKIAAITASKVPLKFAATPQKTGYNVSSLTFNEKRPNISVLIKKEGTVDLKGKAPKEHKLPNKFGSFIFRNYAIVKDGIINMKQLPVRMTKGTIRRLQKEGMPLEAVQATTGETREKAITRLNKASKDRPVNVLLDLSVLPVVNRQMIKDASAKTFFEREVALTKARAAQKVYNAYMKEHFPRESTGFKVQYGEEATSWLKNVGITDYSGFGPKQTQAEAKDFYMGKELKVSLKGISTLPSVKDVKKKLGGKMTTRLAFLAPYVEEVEAYMTSSSFKKGKPFQTWLTKHAVEAKTEVRRLIFEQSKTRFSIIVGQIWFTEFKTLDENSMDIDTDYGTISCSVNMHEVQVNV